MTGIEIFLLLIGCVFMVGSFFLSEKLSTEELNKLSKLSENELKKIISKEVEDAGYQMDDIISAKVEETSEATERAIEKAANEEIMQIHDYSESVMESMKKVHEEILFLYSMLNDKHTEMTSMAGDLQRLAASIRNLKDTMPKAAPTTAAMPTTTVEREPVENPHPAVLPQEPDTPLTQAETLLSDLKFEDDIADTFEMDEKEEETEDVSNDMILKLYESGMSKVDIAKKLKRGLGEVKLVIELYKGDENL